MTHLTRIWLFLGIQLKVVWGAMVDKSHEAKRKVKDVVPVIETQGLLPA